MKQPLLLALAFIAGSSLFAAELGYRVVDNWGALPGGEAWGEVTGVETTRAGTIVALRRSDPPFIELDPSGKILKRWGDRMFVWPHGFRIDAEGFYWVTDGRDAGGRGQQVLKIAPDGKVVMTLGMGGMAGEDADHFNGPADIAFGRDGTLFVADGHGNDRVVKFTRDGTFVKAWGKAGAAPGEFSTPHAIAIDSQGRVFVADRGNRRIQIFDQDGKFLDQWTQFGRPSGLLIRPDDSMFVADVQDKRGIVVGSARTGVVLGVIEGTLPESVAVGADGSVYSGETTTGRTLRKFKKAL